jgi:hypothetical protein
MDLTNIDSYLNTDNHKMHGMGRQERQARQGRLTEAISAKEGHHASSVMNDTRAFRGRFV